MGSIWLLVLLHVIHFSVDERILQAKFIVLQISAGSYTLNIGNETSLWPILSPGRFVSLSYKFKFHLQCSVVALSCLLISYTGGKLHFLAPIGRFVLCRIGLRSLRSSAVYRHSQYHVKLNSTLNIRYSNQSNCRRKKQADGLEKIWKGGRNEERGRS